MGDFKQSRANSSWLLLMMSSCAHLTRLEFVLEERNSLAKTRTRGSERQLMSRRQYFFDLSEQSRENGTWHGLVHFWIELRDFEAVFEQKRAFGIQKLLAKVHGPQSQSVCSILSRAKRMAHRELWFLFKQNRVRSSWYPKQRDFWAKTRRRKSAHP